MQGYNLMENDARIRRRKRICRNAADILMYINIKSHDVDDDIQRTGFSKVSVLPRSTDVGPQQGKSILGKNGKRTIKLWKMARHGFFVYFSLKNETMDCNCITASD